MRVSTVNVDAAEVKCTLSLGDRVVLRSPAPPEAEYALFEIGDIELRKTEPGRVREQGYQTTAGEARARLAHVGMTAALARELGLAMQPVLADAYARGPAVKRVARHLGAVELFASDTYDPGARAYRGVFLDLVRLTRDLELEHASSTLHALFLASLLDAERPDTAVAIATDLWTAEGKPGTRTYKRPTFADPQRLLNTLGGLAHRSPQPDILEALPRSEVIAFLRGRAQAATDEQARTVYRALEGSVALREMPDRGPLASPDLWAIEMQVDARALDGATDAVDEAERRHGRTPGTTYLRARVALALRLEAPKVIAERVSALALSMSSFQELGLLASEAWLEAGEPARAMPYARDLVHAPGLEAGLLLRAQDLYTRATTGTPRSSPITLAADDASSGQQTGKHLQHGSPALLEPEESPDWFGAAGGPVLGPGELLVDTPATPGGPRTRTSRAAPPPPPSETPTSRPSLGPVRSTPPSTQGSQTGERARSFPPVPDLDMPERPRAVPYRPEAITEDELPPPARLPSIAPEAPLSRKPRISGVMVETRPPASFDPRAEPDTPYAPPGSAPPEPRRVSLPAPKLRSSPAPARRASMPRLRPSTAPTVDEAFEQRKTPLRPPPKETVAATQGDSAETPLALSPELGERSPYMHGASLPPFQQEVPAPLLPTAPLLPRLGRDEGELAEHLALPPGIGEQRSLDVLPSSVLEARVQFTLLARELGLDYRLKRGIALGADVSGIEAMQATLLEAFPDRVVRTRDEAHELRRHGALLSEILARRLDAEWLDISAPELGHWVMIVPPDTRVWPFGRVARLVAMGHKERDLVSYFFELMRRARPR